MKYRVVCREVWLRPIDVEAPSKELAIDKVRRGDYCVEGGEMEFSHRTSAEYWTVEEVEPQTEYQLQTERWIEGTGI